MQPNPFFKTIFLWFLICYFSAFCASVHVLLNIRQITYDFELKWQHIKILALNFPKFLEPSKNRWHRFMKFTSTKLSLLWFSAKQIFTCNTIVPFFSSIDKFKHLGHKVAFVEFWVNRKFGVLLLFLQVEKERHS